MRRLPAQRCSTSRTSCSALAAEIEIAYFLEAQQPDGRGALRPVPGRGLDHHGRGRRADPAHPRRVAPAGDDRRLRHRGRRPGAAQLRRRGRLHGGRLREPGVRLDARDLDPDLRPRARRLRAARLPDRPAPAARGDQRLPQRAAPGDRLAQRLHRVQAPRQRVRDGRPRHALPGAGHPRRLRRALPLVRPRLLRLLRADGGSTGRLAEPLALPHGVEEVDLVRVYRTFNAGAPAFREQSEAHER